MQVTILAQPEPRLLGTVKYLESGAMGGTDRSCGSASFLTTIEALLVGPSFSDFERWKVKTKRKKMIALLQVIEVGAENKCRRELAC